MGYPVAPWGLRGELVVAVVWSGAAASSLPPGLHPLPGPRLVVAARYTESPVGPYLELAVGEPARCGVRAGMCVTTIVVDSPEARTGGRANWSLPKELGTLRWSTDGDERSLRWEERGIDVRGVPAGPPLPALVPFRSLQGGTDGPVTAAGRVRGLARLGRVELAIPAADPLAALNGWHTGALVSGARIAMGRPRASATRRTGEPASGPLAEPAR